MAVYIVFPLFAVLILDGRKQSFLDENGWAHLIDNIFIIQCTNSLSAFSFRFFAGRIIRKILAKNRFSSGKTVSAWLVVAIFM